MRLTGGPTLVVLPLCRHPRSGTGLAKMAAMQVHPESIYSICLGATLASLSLNLCNTENWSSSNQMAYSFWSDFSAFLKSHCNSSLSHSSVPEPGVHSASCQIHALLSNLHLLLVQVHP